MIVALQNITVQQLMVIISCNLQDTVLALQALAEFASLTVAPPGDNVGLQLTATYGDESHSFSTITRRNALLLQTVQVSYSRSSSLS